MTAPSGWRLPGWANHVHWHASALRRHDCRRAHRCARRSSSVAPGTAAWPSSRSSAASAVAASAHSQQFPHQHCHAPILTAAAAATTPLTVTAAAPQPAPQPPPHAHTVRLAPRGGL
eukprot:189834-Alexandrium_andersonii.AAC.1